MRFLLFNFRDIKHPNAGGADKMLFELMMRLVADGNSVTWFAPMYKNASRSEEVKGIEIIRKGNKYTVYFWALIYYLFRYRGKIDVVFDSINTIPFFTPIFVKEKKFSIIYQLSGNVLEKTPFKKSTDYYNASFPIFLLSYYIFEPLTLLLYKNTPCITISKSSKDDLVKFGFKKVHTITLGSDKLKLKKFDKEKNPTLIYLSRLVGYKKPEDALRAFRIIKTKIPEAILWVVGDGPLSKGLKAKKQKGVVFWGHVSDSKKYELLSKAHVLLFPSVREGWGLTIVEAGVVGTPTIGYDVHGIRDVIRDGRTGILCAKPEEMAKTAIKLLANKSLYDGIRSSLLDYSKSFSWGETKREFIRAIGIELNKNNEQ